MTGAKDELHLLNTLSNKSAHPYCVVAVVLESAKGQLQPSLRMLYTTSQHIHTVLLL